MAGAGRRGSGLRNSCALALPRPPARRFEHALQRASMNILARARQHHRSASQRHGPRVRPLVYDPQFLFWEVADTTRKLILTSFVLFVDTNYGSRKLLRACVALFVSSLYLAALALARPFKRDTDLYLACTSNLLLICCFVSGIVVKLCEEWDCYEIIGFTNSVGATASVILLSIAMLVLALADMVYKAYNAPAEHVLLLRKTNLEPELSLAGGCSFHGFISHAWYAARCPTNECCAPHRLR